MRIHIQEIPYDAPTFHLKLRRFLMQRIAHLRTEGVPAPFPEHEIFRVCAERIEAGEPIEIYDDREQKAESLPEYLSQDQINEREQQRSLWTRIIEVIA